jgi:predicted PurR-regulated permease PerM
MTNLIIGDNRAFKFILGFAAFIIIVAGMKASQSVIVPVLLSVFIAIISAPALFWLENKKVPRIVAFMIVGAGVLLMLSLVGMVISSSVNDFMNDLPEYQEKLHRITQSTLDLAERHNMPLSKATVIKHINPSVLLGFSGKMIGGIGGILSNAFLIFLTVAFILFESSSFPRKLKMVSVNPDSDVDPIGKFTTNIKKYLVIKTLTSLSTGLLVVLWLYFFDVDYALLWGLIAFFLNFIPSIGSILAAIPAILLALIQHDWKVALWVSLGYLIINSVIGNVIEPKYMGKGLGLSPLVVFLSLIFWGWVLGPVGMFLSVPLTMTAKIACDSNDSTKWIGVFLGP